MEEKLKHLEFVQNVITRMSQNSFLIKGWTVTIISALFALAASNTNKDFIVIAYFPTIIFWLLDGYFLYQERLYRKLYKHIIAQPTADFSLDTQDFDEGMNDWTKGALSKTIILFYGGILLTLLTVMFSIQNTCI